MLTAWYCRMKCRVQMYTAEKIRRTERGNNHARRIVEKLEKNGTESRQRLRHEILDNPARLGRSSISTLTRGLLAVDGPGRASLLAALTAAVPWLFAAHNLVSRPACFPGGPA